MRNWEAVKQWEDTQMTMKMGLIRTEMKKPADDHVALQWGKCKRPRLSKASAVQTVQKSDIACQRDKISTLELTHMQLKPAGGQDVVTKGETENSCIDHQSPSSEKPGNDCVLAERDANKSRASPSRNGHARRRTELESLHDTQLVMKDLKLAVSKWPKLLISLSHKEKEDDFMLMKGARLPQRPRKRAKHVEKVVTFVSPGSWLCEVSLDRYEVREKKCPRRKPAGLKAMESMDMDSDSG